MKPASRPVFQNSAACPLGAIKLAGFNHQTRGGGIGFGTPRRLSSYAIVYSLNGRCAYWDEHIGQRILLPGDLILLCPGVAHSYGAGAHNEHWDEFFVVFEGPIFDLWRKSGVISVLDPIHRVEPVPHWLRRLESCLEDHGMLGRAATLRQLCQLQALLADVLGQSGVPALTSSHPQWLALATSALDNGTLRSPDLLEVARSVGVSLETFRKKFTQIMGMPPSQYRAARTIDRACVLLVEAGLSGKEIAVQLGFSDEFHFSRRFKQVTGFSPRQFKEHVLPSSVINQ